MTSFHSETFPALRGPIPLSSYWHPRVVMWTCMVLTMSHISTVWGHIHTVLPWVPWGRGPSHRDGTTHKDLQLHAITSRHRTKQRTSVQGPLIVPRSVTLRLGALTHPLSRLWLEEHETWKVIAPRSTKNYIKNWNRSLWVGWLPKRGHVRLCLPQDVNNPRYQSCVSENHSYGYHRSDRHGTLIATINDHSKVPCVSTGRKLHS